MRQEIRALQAGANSLGFDAGKPDGIWGPRTRAGLTDLLGAHLGRWGDPIEEMNRALIDLGYLSEGPVSRVWTPELDRALRLLIAADGLARAGAVIEPGKAPGGNSDWSAHEKMLFQGRALYPVQLFVLHTTATPGSWWRSKSNRQMFDEVRRWHLDKGWRDIGYHGLICPDGEVIEGRAWDQIGAHVMGHNAGSLGYSMVPIRTINRMGKSADFYTTETHAAMRHVIARACAATQVTRIAGHNEFANKLCPGFRVVDREWAPAGWAA